MSINLNGTTPAAPANNTNVQFQSDASGNVSAYFPTSPSQVAKVGLTAQTANIAATTLATPVASALYKASVYIIVTTVGSVSSTMPKVTLTWTDPDNNTAQTLDVTATNTGNLLTTFAQGMALINAKLGTNIQYATSGYASSAAGMAYSLYIVLEQVI
jgi:hypothetical protein